MIDINRLKDVDGWSPKIMLLTETHKFHERGKQAQVKWQGPGKRFRASLEPGGEKGTRKGGAAITTEGLLTDFPEEGQINVVECSVEVIKDALHMFCFSVYIQPELQREKVLN